MNVLDFYKVLAQVSHVKATIFTVTYNSLIVAHIIKSNFNSAYYTGSIITDISGS